MQAIEPAAIESAAMVATALELQRLEPSKQELEVGKLRPALSKQELEVGKLGEPDRQQPELDKQEL